MIWLALLAHIMRRAFYQDTFDRETWVHQISRMTAWATATRPLPTLRGRGRARVGWARRMAGAIRMFGTVLPAMRRAHADRRRGSLPTR